MASVASIYARAFADVVLDKKLDAQRAIGNLHRIATLLDENVELRRVWENPAVPAEQKHKLLDAIVHLEGIEKPVRNLVAVLMNHRRMMFLDRIIVQLEKEIDARLGFAEAEIQSARDLGDPEKRILEAQIGKLTGQKVRTHFRQDASLLGGVIVRVGSTIYDGSVRGQLEKIKEAISS